jgi:hypothetical protein
MSEQAPAGWYPDGQGNERFWDGGAWTDSIRAAAALPASPDDAGRKKEGAFAKLTASVKQSVADRQTAKDEAERKHIADAEAAGTLVTSGVFGSSTVEIYQGGYVRVAVGSEDRSVVASITKKTPYESLRSIKYTPSDAEKAAAAPSSALEGAVGSAVTALLKGGKNLVKSTVPGLAAAGIAHVASTGSRRSFLIITTDRAIHTLSNQTHNGYIKTSNKGHIEVARELEAAGNAVLGIADASAHPAVAEPKPMLATRSAHEPTIAERLREFAGLHTEQILSDEEFAAAKAKLLAGL